MIASIALALVAAACVIGYAVIVARTRRSIGDDLLMIAVVCVVASCTVAPK